MPFALNKKKIDRIKAQGVTADCPLWVGIDKAMKLPSWIWQSNEIKRETLDLMCHHFNRQLVVYIKTIVGFGGTASDNDVAEKLGWHPSTVSARRNKLKQLGIIDTNPVSCKKGSYQAKNKIWSLNFSSLYDFFINQGGFNIV
jgi:hypothetical protein